MNAKLFHEGCLLKPLSLLCIVVVYMYRLRVLLKLMVWMRSYYKKNVYTFIEREQQNTAETFQALQ